MFFSVFRHAQRSIDQFFQFVQVAITAVAIFNLLAKDFRGVLSAGNFFIAKIAGEGAAAGSHHKKHNAKQNKSKYFFHGKFPFLFCCPDCILNESNRSDTSGTSFSI